MKVTVGSILFRYTNQQNEVEAQGDNLAEVFEDLEQKFPGLKFRIVDERGNIRPHIKVYITDHWAKDLSATVLEQDEIHIIGALSGG